MEVLSLNYLGSGNTDKPTNFDRELAADGGSDNDFYNFLSRFFANNQKIMHQKLR